MTNKKTLILGLGNNILTDDGIGSRLVCDLAQMIDDLDVHYNTACCGGLEIIEYIKGYEQVVFIDAIRTPEGRPGDVFYFIPSDFRETSHLSSLHDISFLTALKLGNSLNLGLPTDLHIIAVEIIEDMEFSEEFTPPLKERYPRILEEVFALVKRIMG
ncbi:MAG: hydrogenase maturation protease [Bacteroidales bacterium]|jgi:hydrogenase maturation protease